MARNYATILATLSAIGGVDERPRLGGLVQHEEWGVCTIAKIAANGKITVQPHDFGPMKMCRLTELSVVRVFNVSLRGGVAYLTVKRIALPKFAKQFLCNCHSQACQTVLF